jgi:hypothetical protein
MGISAATQSKYIAYKKTIDYNSIGNTGIKVITRLSMPQM